MDFVCNFLFTLMVLLFLILLTQLGTSEKLTLCEVEVFTDNLDINWTGEELVNGTSDDIFDANNETCISKSQIVPGKAPIIGTLSVDRLDESTSSLSEFLGSNITIAVTGQFSQCDDMYLAYIEEESSTPDCLRVQACDPDKTRNDLLSSSGRSICFATCKCLSAPCNIMFIPWHGTGAGGVQNLCDVAVFKYDNPSIIPTGID